MNARGLYRNSKDYPVPTKETMHWTVRVLLGLHLRECPALHKYSTKLEGESRIIWTLHISRQKRETAIKLYEDEFSKLEHDLLISWAIAEGYNNDLVTGVNFSATISIGTVKRYLSDLLIPQLGEVNKPTIQFPPDSPFPGWEDPADTRWGKGSVDIGFPRHAEQPAEFSVSAALP